MRIRLTLSSPFYEVFKLRETVIKAPDDSTVADAVQILIDKYNAEGLLREKKLISEDRLTALYALNKEIGGGTIITDDYVLKEADSVTILGTYIGG